MGRRPIPFGAEIARTYPQEAGKVALFPSAAERADDTPSRRLRSCSLAAFIHAFAELPLLTWPHLALPLLHTAGQAGDSLFLSPLGSTVAASQLRSGMRGVSKNRERLAPGSIPAHADPSGDYINIGMAHTLFTCVMPTPRRLTARPAACRACHSDRSPVLSLTLSGWFLPLPSHVLQAMSLDCSGAAGAAQKGEYRVRGFGGVFTFPL